MTKLIEMGNFAIGADPEVFMWDPKTKQYRSSIGKIGGTKLAPRVLPGYQAHGIALQEDNVAIEFNMHPVSQKEMFVKGVQKGLEAASIEAKKYNCDIRIDPTALFDPSELLDPLARMFGCEPDYCVWTGFQNPAPDAEKSPWRSAAGHIHIGTHQSTYPMVPLFPPRLLPNVVKAMDLFVGVPSLFMDKDQERRKQYGRAGAFRPKCYGVEYRVLSNFWLRSRELTEWVFDQTKRAVTWVADGNVLDSDAEAAIPHCIDTFNMDIANLLKEKFQLVTVQ